MSVGEIPARITITLRRSDAEVERLKLVITHLVDSISRDAADLQKTVKDVDPERVYATWIEMHVRELVAAREAIERQREFQRSIKNLIEE